MDLDDLALWRAGEPCPRCSDSGYAETVSGGVWTGDNIRITHTICDCPCGEDVLRELRMKGTIDEESCRRD